MSAIEVSCPSCGELNIIEMKLHETLNSGFMKILEPFLDGSGIKNYHFTGGNKCSKCSEYIEIALTVSNLLKNRNTSTPDIFVHEGSSQ